MTPSLLKLRASEVGDAPLLYEAAGKCIQEMAALGLCQWDAAYPSIRVFENDATSRAGHIFPAGDEIVGYFALTEKLDSEYATLSWSCAGRSAVFKRLLVRPKYGRQGLGRALLLSAEQLAKMRGIEALGTKR
jgi:GNAT superfamily N-acetyltransferase